MARKAIEDGILGDITLGRGRVAHSASLDSWFKGGSAWELSPDGAMMEITDYGTTGSGSLFALGVLETLYKKDMTIDQGVELVNKAINASIQRDIYSGNGITIVTVTKEGVKTVLEKEINVGL